MNDAHPNTATYVGKAGGNWTPNGEARLYRLNPPVEFSDWDSDGEQYASITEHVTVSAVDVFGVPETYIFPARPDGTAVSMLELEGSARGMWDHAKALRDAGYEVR